MDSIQKLRDERDALLDELYAIQTKLDRVCEILARAELEARASEQRGEAKRAAINNLVSLKERFGSLGMHLTMHAMEYAVTASGRELAGMIEAAHTESAEGNGYE